MFITAIICLLDHITQKNEHVSGTLGISFTITTFEN